MRTVGLLLLGMALSACDCQGSAGGGGGDSDTDADTDTDTGSGTGSDTGSETASETQSETGDDLDCETLDVSDCDLDVWECEVLDTGAGDHAMVAAGVDTEGVLRLAYAAPGDGERTDLRHARLLAGEWCGEIVEEGPPSGWGPIGPSIAFDGSGTTHLAWARWDLGEIHYASEASGAWEDPEVVDTMTGGAGDPSWATAIAADPDGEPHVTYYWRYDDVPEQFRHAERVDGDWDAETVDGNAFGRGTGLVVDGDGVAHATYYGPGFRYATNEDGSWSTTTLEGGGVDSALVIDGSGFLHASFGISPDEVLRYGNTSSGSWEIETATGNAAYATSLVLSHDDEPIIACTSDAGITVASQVGGVWSDEIVDPDLSPWSNTAIAVDAEGTVHVFYVVSLMGGATELRHAWLE